MADQCRIVTRPAAICPQTLWDFLTGVPCPPVSVKVCPPPPPTAQERRDAEAMSRMNDALERCARRFGPTACYR